MYQPGYSVIHGINAAVKLVCLILLLAAVVATDSVPGYVVSILTTAAIVYLAQISIPDALRLRAAAAVVFRAYSF